MARPLSLKKAANKKRALRKRGRKPLSKKRVLKAILHSGGLRSKIAEACHVSVSTLSKYLKKDSWQDVREALHDEEQRVADNAEKAIQDAINQRNDISTAASTAKWYLERKTPERGYAKQETLKLTQDTPLQVEHRHISVHLLQKLPLDARRLLLAELEQQDTPKQLPPPLTA